MFKNYLAAYQPSPDTVFTVDTDFYDRIPSQPEGCSLVAQFEVPKRNVC